MSGLVQETPLKTLAARELHPTFAAEIEGVNFDNLSDEQLAEIKDAMAKYGVCVFRNTGLTDDTHVEFSRKLGDLDDIRRYLGPGRKMRYQHVELFDAGNLDADSNLIDPDSARAHGNKGNGLFHVDSSFNPRRASYSLLRGVVLPPPEAGGNTDFADSRAAWEDLPEALKTELLEKDYVGAHCMAHSRKQGSPEFFAELDPGTAPMSYHRIAQLHEPSGRMNLYVGAHLHHIEGVSAEKSAQLVEALNNHTRQQKYITSVAWHTPGDLVIWDNRAVLHRAGQLRGIHKRDMRRTTVHDDGSYAWGENNIGTRMPGNESWLKPQLVQQMSGPSHTTAVPV